MCCFLKECFVFGMCNFCSLFAPHKPAQKPIPTGNCLRNNEILDTFSHLSRESGGTSPAAAGARPWPSAGWPSCRARRRVQDGEGPGGTPRPPGRRGGRGAAAAGPARGERGQRPGPPTTLYVHRVRVTQWLITLTRRDELDSKQHLKHYFSIGRPAPNSPLPTFGSRCLINDV